MKPIVRIAFRNTQRQRKRSFLLGGAIAFGVLVITIINAFTAGMIVNVKNNFSFIAGGHIFISGKELSDSGRVITAINDTAIVDESLKLVEPFVKKVNKRSSSLAQLIFGSWETNHTIEGVDWQKEEELAAKLVITDGSLEGLAKPNAMVLPKPIARRLGVVAGETILARLSTITGQQNVGEFYVTAIVEDQTNFGATSAYVHLDYLNDLLSLNSGSYQMILLFLHDMATMDQVSNVIYGYLKEHAEVDPRVQLDLYMGSNKKEDAEKEEEIYEAERKVMAQIFGGGYMNDEEPWEGTKFAVMTLNDFMQPVMAMVGILNTVALVVFLILLVIIMVGITNTFRMILIERTREIGTMRSFGMQQKDVRNIFLWEAVFIGLGGALSGLFLAWVIMTVVGFIKLDGYPVLQFFMNNGHFTFLIQPASVIMNLLILLVMTLFAAYMPARAAARLRPADALRAHY
ncbi:MAG TPA: ABC transporter permease [Firmicutes bacterium]|nr:ABC transporter permease [Bacillota bacterium]